MLFRSLDKLKRTAIMTTIVLMFIGNILLVLPEAFIPFLSDALAFVLLVTCVVGIFDFISSKKALIHYIYLFVSLFAGLLGVMFFTFDTLLTDVLYWVVGVLPILAGIYGVYHALAFARRSGRKGWWILIVLSLFLMVFGGFIFYNPWMDSPQAVMQVIGGTLMYSAFLSALRLVWLWPIHNNQGGEAA